MQKNLSVNDAVNVVVIVLDDAAERVLGLATEVNNKTAPRNEEQLQAMYKVVKGTRRKLHSIAKSFY